MKIKKLPGKTVEELTNNFIKGFSEGERLISSFDQSMVGNPLALRLSSRDQSLSLPSEPVSELEKDYINQVYSMDRPKLIKVNKHLRDRNKRLAVSNHEWILNDIELTDELEKLKAQNKGFSEDCTMKSAEIDRLTLLNKGLSYENKLLSDRCDGLSERFKPYSSQIPRIEEEFAQLKEQIKGFSDDSPMLGEKYQTITEKIKVLSDDYVKLDDRNKRLAKDNLIIKSEAAKYRIEIRGLNKEILGLKDKNKDLSDDYKNILTKTLEDHKRMAIFIKKILKDVEDLRTQCSDVKDYKGLSEKYKRRFDAIRGKMPSWISDQIKWVIKPDQYRTVERLWLNNSLFYCEWATYGQAVIYFNHFDWLLEDYKFEEEYNKGPKDPMLFLKDERNLDLIYGNSLRTFMTRTPVPFVICNFK